MLNSNVSREDNAAISVGRVPTREFWLRIKVCNFVHFDSCGGMVPVNKLRFNESFSKLESRPNSDGICPEKLLLSSNKLVRFIKPNSVGIVPVKKKFSKSSDSGMKKKYKSKSVKLEHYIYSNNINWFLPKLLSNAISVGILPRGLKVATAESREIFENIISSTWQ